MTDNIIDRQIKEIERVLGPLLPQPGEKIALVDFPNHANVGDSAIWLGEYLFLQKNDLIKNAFHCEIESYSRDNLREVVGDGTIFIHGGGNLGDLWPRHHTFRERVIRDFPDNRIIQLPQSICFRSGNNIKRSREIFEAHGNLIILARDQSSLDIATSDLNTEAYLCPDMAFFISRIKPSTEATIPCIWLFRSDLESRNPEPRKPHDGVWISDWQCNLLTKMSRANVILQNTYMNETDEIAKNVLREKLSNIYPQLARERVGCGCNYLSRAHNVITERLHGHILCVLLGIPHVILDSRYAKIRNYTDVWGYDSSLVQWAETEEEALSKISVI